MGARNCRRSLDCVLACRVVSYRNLNTAKWSVTGARVNDPETVVAAGFSNFLARFRLVVFSSSFLQSFCKVLVKYLSSVCKFFVEFLLSSAGLRLRLSSGRVF